MKIHFLAVMAGALLVCGCHKNEPQPSSTPYHPLYGGLTPQDWSRLSLCGGGFKNAVDLNLQYKIAQDIRSGNLSAGVSQELQAAFLADSALPEADREKAFESYLTCVNNIKVH